MCVELLFLGFGYKKLSRSHYLRNILKLISLEIVRWALIFYFLAIRVEDKFLINIL